MNSKYVIDPGGCGVPASGRAKPIKSHTVRAEQMVCGCETSFLSSAEYTCCCLTQMQRGLGADAMADLSLLHLARLDVLTVRSICNPKPT